MLRLPATKHLLREKPHDKLAPSNRHKVSATALVDSQGSLQRLNAERLDHRLRRGRFDVNLLPERHPLARLTSWLHSRLHHDEPRQHELASTLDLLRSNSCKTR